MQVHQLPHAEDSKMASLFGGGFDALQTPSMTQGDENSVEESKVPDPSLVDAGDGGGTADCGKCEPSFVVRSKCTVCSHCGIECTYFACHCL